MAGPRTPLLKPRAYFDSKSPPFDLQRVALVVGAYLVYQFGTLDLPADPDGALSVMQAALASLDLLGTLVALVVVAWTTYIRTYGLACARDIAVGDAAVVTVSLSFIGFLINLA
ncbi:hypothetical protein [Haloferax sp. DFSO60]|uniref:hypothetical protein n=1 Tax=Haloferax sp. DFSO60 TaxID=3388652 RepID=UPI00397BDBA7